MRLGSLRQIFVTCLMLTLLAGCSSGRSSWMKGDMFGDNTVEQDEEIPKGPLTVPKAAPVPPVEAKPLNALQLPATSAPMAPTMMQAAPVSSPSTKGNKTKVALLLPLTGKNGPLGQSMLNAAQQAVFDIAPQNFELMPRDTGGNEEQVDMAARDAVASGAQLLIGPLFAAHVPAVHNVAQGQGINMLALSSDSSLAAPGLYVMGFAPDTQAERVTRYALAHGLGHVGALIPDNAYGNLVGQALRNELDRDGGTLVEFGIFAADHHDLDTHIHDMVARKGAVDALFLPETGDELNDILKRLTAAGFDVYSVKLLGTGLWDTADFARNTPAAVGGWYAAADPAARRRFVDTYRATFGQDPQRLATLAYDATALAAVQTKRGAGFDQASLTNPNGFAGLDGIFRLSPQGQVERGLAILEVAADGSHVVDPAPATFVSHGH